jgi:predicted transcriptional regulator
VQDIDPSIRYTIRIFSILREQQEIGISDLASRTGINHKRCNTVLERLCKQGYVLLRSGNNGRKCISVTAKGQDYITRLFSLILAE